MIKGGKYTAVNKLGPKCQGPKSFPVLHFQQRPLTLRKMKQELQGRPKIGAIFCTFLSLSNITNFLLILAVK